MFFSILNAWVILVPVVKDETGSLSSVDNSKPIALGSVLSTVLEDVLLERQQYLITTGNQFGFNN